jgi:hypothetical protein
MTGASDFDFTLPLPPLHRNHIIIDSTQKLNPTDTRVIAVDVRELEKRCKESLSITIAISHFRQIVASVWKAETEKKT